MVDMAARYLGATLDYTGHVEQDDAVWLSVVRRKPLLIESPTSKSARNVERIARRVLALATSREQPREAQPIAVTEQEPTLYEVLWTHPGATDEELRRAYKRQRDIFQPGSLPITSLLNDTELARERARVEEAHDTLLDPVRRRAYDISTFPDSADTSQNARPQVDGAILAERAMLREELAREIHAETEFTGRLLQRVRESQGIEVEDIAQRTKITIAHVHAIEAEDFGKLPAQVYARGFVQQIAKLLGLDPTQVSRTYLRRMRQWQKAQDVPSP
jgi:flagellar biosynthesis protein FlhG